MTVTMKNTKSEIMAHLELIQKGADEEREKFNTETAKNEAEIERLHSERDAYEVQVSESEEEVRLAKAELVHITREWERCLLENKEIIERLNRAVQENFNLREEVLGLAEQLRELQEGLPEVGSLGASLGAVEGLMGILEDCKTGSPIVDLQIRQAITHLDIVATRLKSALELRARGI